MERGPDTVGMNLSILRHRRAAVGLLLLTAALLARLPYFNESLWYDEVWYTAINLGEESFKRVLLHDVHPPLYPVLMKGWIGIFGDSEVSVRLPSLAFGLVSLGVLFALTSAWFNSRTALLATALMAFSPVHIWHSQENKNNMLLMLLTLLTVYFLQRAWANDRRRDWLLFVVSAIPALWTSHFALWVVAACFMWLWLAAVRDRGQRSFIPIAGSTLVVGLGYLPLVWLTLRDTGAMVKGYLRPFTLEEVYRLLLVYLSHGNTLRTISPYDPLAEILEQHWGFLVVDGFFALLLGAGLFLVVRHWAVRRKETAPRPVPESSRTDLLLFYFMLPPLALLAASLIYPKIYIERSMIILLPPFLILISHGVMSMSRLKWRKAVLSVLLFASILALANLWVIKRDAWTVYKPNPDWRALAAEVTDDTSGTVVITGCPPLAMRYYLEGSRSIAISLRTGRDVDPRIVADDARRLFWRRGIRYPKFFYVAINRHWGDKGAAKMNEQVFRKEYPLFETMRFAGLDVYKYGFYP